MLFVLINFLWKSWKKKRNDFLANLVLSENWNLRRRYFVYTEKSKHRWSMSGHCWRMSRWKLKTIHRSKISGHRFYQCPAHCNAMFRTFGVWALSSDVRDQIAISTNFYITCDTLFTTLLGTILRYFVHSQVKNKCKIPAVWAYLLSLDFTMY